MDFKISEDNFKLSGKDFFIYSGEIHYFRLEPGLWPSHLKKAKSAGLNTISTYIPWDWHEYEETKFDFTGQTNPQRNLLGFIELCKKNGLFMIVKPGPSIFAEYIRYGIPQWLLSSYPDALSINSEGKPFDTARVTLMHQAYLKLVRGWYNEVFGLIKENSVVKPGRPIIAVQLCNETANFNWFSKEADYNPVCLDYYRRFLSDKYTKIARLNTLYKMKYKGFGAVMPPAGEVSKPTEFIAELDWHLFWRNYYTMYLEYLIKEIAKKQLHLPLIHNMPGWINGRALEYPLNMGVYRDAAKLYPKVLFSVDHMPESISYKNFHDVGITQKTAKAMQSNRGPLFVSEMQAGTREYNIVAYPDELELFYKSSLAEGASGINFYMFSQGKNPKGTSVTSPTFYWQTPLSYEGREGALYPVIRRLGKIVSMFGELLSKARPRSKVALLFYKPYYYTEFIRSWNAARFGLNCDPRHIRDNILFDGIAKALKALNCDYDIVDLESCKAKDLAAYKQVWVVSLEYMDADSQKTLANYALSGGHLVMFVRIPTYDLSLKPCSIFKEALKIGETKEITVCDPTAEILDVKEIKVLNPICTFEAANAESAGTLFNGSACGIIKHFGSGWALILGTAFTYSSRESLEAYTRILKKDEICGEAYSTNEHLITSEIFGASYAFLFVANYYRTPESGYITFTDPEAPSKRLTIPKAAKLSLPGSSGILIPINVPVKDSAARINFSTAQILSAFERGGSIYMELYGWPGVAEEISIALKKRPKQVFVDGKKVEFSHREGETLVSFKRGAENSALLKINLS